VAKTVKAFKARHYSVDCRRNDPVDIKAGGPAYIGFDFFVDADKNVKKVKEKIEQILKRHKMPLISIGSARECLVETLWTDKMIEKCIKDHSKEYI
jgi:hypothetical protein